MPIKKDSKRHEQEQNLCDEIEYVSILQGIQFKKVAVVVPFVLADKKINIKAKILLLAFNTTTTLSSMVSLCPPGPLWHLFKKGNII